LVLEKFEQMKETVGQWSTRGALAMLEVAERLHALAGELADLMSAIFIVTLHQDRVFKKQAYSAGRAFLTENGFKGKIYNFGWQQTTILLRHGLRLTLWTPYLRPSRRGMRGRPKTQRGAAGKGVFPILAAMGIRDGVTPDARSVIARQVVQCGSVEETFELLRLDGLDVDIAVLIRVAVATGDVAISLRDEALKKALNGPLPEISLVEGLIVRVSVDGGRVRLRKVKTWARRNSKTKRLPFETPWREPRLVTVDVLDTEGKSDPTWTKIYETTLGDADDTFRLLTGLLRLLGVDRAATLLFVSDGAEWIWNRVSKMVDDIGISKDRVRLVLDYYHASEHIGNALGACKNLKADAALKLHRELNKRLLEEGGPAAVVAHLRTLARGRRRKAINCEISYIEGHLSHMMYAELREEKLAIGSGVVESGVRRVINMRFKSAGTFWREEHVAPLMELRAILKSGRWQTFIRALLVNEYHLNTSSFKRFVQVEPALPIAA
jgi:hypothetical protein